jgi:lipopolysaccharide/colanic/teichoic acid biosynthesis glycosyltransferase
MNIPIPPLLSSALWRRATENRSHVSNAVGSVSVRPLAEAINIHSSEQFAAMLELERRRTERSGNCFALMLLRFDVAGVNGNLEALTQQVAGVVCTTVRETDLVGWYEDAQILGVIFTELGSVQNAGPAVVSIRSKIKTAFHGLSDSQIAMRLTMSFHLYPEDDRGMASPSEDDHSATLKKRPRSSAWLESRGKRLIDILGSVLALLFLAPIFGAVAIGIKLTSRGPIFFRQERVGQHGKRFTFLKFRSMVDGNDCAVHREYVRGFIKGSQDASNGGVYKLTHDSRVTPIGKFIRKTSLDELPQFWNVLRGEMSLVGPRPPLPYEIEEYDLWHRKRFLLAKPGITGLWQVNGRSRTTFDDMVRLDLRYARSSSLSLDLAILCRTPLAVIHGSGAF